MGHEAEHALQLTDNPKNVVVIGAGPAGMESAARLARQGHKVTVLERSTRLGGTLFFASLVYDANARLLEYLKAQLDHPNIQVKLNTEATPELLASLKPDEVIVACGAKREKAEISGADQRHVWSGDELRQVLLGESKELMQQKLTLVQRALFKSGQVSGLTDSLAASRKLSQFWMPLGDNVTIIGGGLVGLELAEFLAERGRNVTVLEPSNMLGEELSIVRRWRVLHEVAERGVTLHKNVTVEQIGKDSVSYRLKDDDALHTLAADSVILASGAVPNTDLAEHLAEHYSVHQIGDGQSVDYIEGALASAWHVAQQIK